MSLKHTIITLGITLGVAANLGILTSSTSIAEDAITAPATKSIGTSSTQKTELVPSLIVMNSDGATLKGDTLTLTSISNNSILFADRPVRSAGHALTTHLLEEWAQGGSFEKDPPNATVSVLNKDASSVEDAVVVLKEPKLEGANLTFKVDILEGSLAKADGPASIFIDIIGMPRTPRSFAGVARRTAYRGAWYGAAAAGAAAAAYDRPYYRPYYPPPACGYYPLPPC
ncbi:MULTISPECIES: hypothetical protein [unclassified Rhizobium]|uniref:hypothetical protein n=1 Tax=unclassified Rhizobium TaxID=2613769 RepID=UPI00146CFCDA|nr:MULTISPECIES: hypothetical protein [unclassified Rhizobium]MBD9450318.1 hypothetical protein [Rhizobium sp. RHZ02]NMN71895.1 hypothetical protein [Rhizobium sp. 57MFTsu3.2]